MPILVSTPEHISIRILEKSIGKFLSVHLKLDFEIIPPDGSQSPVFQNINTTTLMDISVVNLTLIFYDYYIFSVDEYLVIYHYKSSIQSTGISPSSN